MTLFTQGKPSRKRTVWGHNNGTTTEDVYVCPANCVAEVTYVLVNNSGGSSNSVAVKWYDASDSYTSNFVSGKNLSAGEWLQFADIEIVLEAGDKIQVTPSSTGHIDSIVTVTETFIPVG